MSHLLLLVLVVVVVVVIVVVVVGKLFPRGAPENDELTLEAGDELDRPRFSVALCACVRLCVLWARLTR